MAKVVKKKKKKLGSAFAGSGGAAQARQTSPLRPKWVPKTPPCQDGCPSGTDIRAVLTALAQTAGAIVVDRFQQKISRINPATYIGKGKAKMLWDRVEEHEADVVIFDNDLTPGQIRELETDPGATSGFRKNGFVRTTCGWNRS